ncbi:MAG: NADH-quinone oxidoreductase subunit L [Bacteroidota bacterium]|jgi:NADH-quinone oxidoreductase subunit L
MVELIYLVPLLPLIGFFIIGFFGKKLNNEKLVGAIASIAVGGAFLVALGAFLQLTGESSEARTEHIVRLFTWIQAGSFHIDIAYQVDQLSILYTLIITGIGTLIHIYSVGYMHGDKSFPRFFAYLNLFVFMMLNLVLANNFVLTFLGWEGVGLCSYLLIGFWYDRKFEGSHIVWTGDAAKKAFIVNRIGDFGVLIAMFLIYMRFGSLEYTTVNMAAASGGIDAGLITAITLLLFLGCTGKSAQIPLGIWLPDAMAGPTPVSALIHAATMVTAGIFLIARNSTLFALSHTTMAIITGVGITTALIAATIGIVQNDIKKVLAYSTVSQLGFMFMALGVGAYTAAVFHVMTHAFFKALLFLGSGSVIHGMHEEQDIQKMGGLKKYMPQTYITFLLGTIAISGIFPFSGFFSKDEILWNAYANGSPILWGAGVLAAFCTAFYMFRLLYLTFYGEERFDHHHVHPHESPLTMTLPLWILAILSVFGGLLGIPKALSGGADINILEHWLEPIFANANSILASHHSDAHHHSLALEWGLMAASLAIAIIGILYATSLYRKSSHKPAEMAAKNKGLYNILWNKYFVDEIYHNVFVAPIYKISLDFLWKIVDVQIIDGIVNGSARAIAASAENLRKIQSGIAQNYALMMLFGIVAIIAWMVFA